MASETISLSFTFLRLAVYTIVGVVAVSVIRTILSDRKVLPQGVKPLPGPKGWPIVGNALDIPPSHAWIKFKEWADEFGPIYQVNAFGTILVIISKESVANELLGLRGAVYSDRPPLIMVGLISDNGFLGAMRWADPWRNARRFTQSMLTSSMIQQTLPTQTVEARQMVVDLVSDTSKYAYWIERAGVVTSVKQIYGIKEERGQAEKRHVDEICSYMDEIDRVAAPGVYAVELLPWLLYLPAWLAPFKLEAKALAQRHRDYMTSLMHQQSQKNEDSMVKAPESFAGHYLKSKQDWGLTEKEMVWVLSSIYGGAAGTSTAAMQSVILNMCLFPDWQHQMQKEIDEAIGDQRLPDFSDFSSLPTMRAIIKESMRWRPVLSGGFPHALIKDDVYEGYFVPKGAVIIANQWGILHDEQMYPDPESFKPERWLKSGYPTYKEPLTTYPNLKRFAGFGHGRRICPGIEVAEKALFLQVSSLFWACSVTKGKDDGGKDVEIHSYAYTGGAISTPLEFRFDLEERTSGRLKMMEEAALAGHAKEMSMV